MTESLCQPNGSRKIVNELLFECYGVPKVAFGLDSAFSYYYNNQPKNGMIVSSGYQNTHLIPVLNSKLILNNCKRINVGGLNHTNFLLRLLQLKYPILAKEFNYWLSEVFFFFFFFFSLFSNFNG